MVHLRNRVFPTIGAITEVTLFMLIFAGRTCTAFIVFEPEVSNSMKNNNALIFYCVCLFLFPLQSQASPFYSESGIGQTSISISEREYKPYIARAKLGYQISDIYAVEAQIGTHVYGDELDSNKMKVQNLSGIFLRYGTSANTKLRAYAIAGYAIVNTRLAVPQGTILKEYRDFAYGIGFEERLVSLPSLIFTLEYTRYYSDDDIEITGINAGIRASF